MKVLNDQEDTSEALTPEVTWLLTTTCTVPWVVYDGKSLRWKVSYTMPWPAKAASPCSRIDITCKRDSKCNTSWRLRSHNSKWMKWAAICFYNLCLSTWKREQGTHATVRVWKSEDNLVELDSFFLYLWVLGIKQAPLCTEPSRAVHNFYKGNASKSFTTQSNRSTKGF